MPNRPPAIILASASSARRKLLEAAGLAFSVVPAQVDEAAIREALVGSEPDIDPADVAEILARAKADDVSTGHPDALVIGADQVLAMDGDIFSKPADLAEARITLSALRDGTHELHSALALATGGEVVWTHVETATLTMRAFSDAFLHDYIARVGDGVLRSVGAYEIEGPGLQLFERIEGDYWTILGLPLLPLMAELRHRNVIAG